MMSGTGRNPDRMTDTCEGGWGYGTINKSSRYMYLLCMYLMMYVAPRGVSQHDTIPISRRFSSSNRELILTSCLSSNCLSYSTQGRLFAVREQTVSLLKKKINLLIKANSQEAGAEHPEIWTPGFS